MLATSPRSEFSFSSSVNRVQSSCVNERNTRRVTIRRQRLTRIALRITCPQGNSISNSARSVWDKDPSSTRRARSGPTCGNSSPSGGISITIITVVTYTTSRPATTSPRIRLAVPAPTPTTPTRPHRRLPVHTSGLPAAPRLIRIATSAVPSTAVSSGLLAYSLLSALASLRKFILICYGEVVPPFIYRLPN